MPSWTGYSCAKCKNRILWEGEDPFYAIGVPIINCPECGAVNDRSSRRNEWDLMSSSKKIPVYATAVLGSLFFGIGAGVAVAVGINGEQELEMRGSLVLWAVAGSVVGFALIGRWLQNTINDSRLRLQDKSYQNKLKQLGLMKDSFVSKPTFLELSSKTRSRQSDLLLWIVVIVMIGIAAVTIGGSA